ncbi:hypothetical protein IGI04_016818 [Brassica rapa subsp. trilocularis]|uniref:Uncharacterized protein n=1 Tax=Brassica rapa subsp. trilocularis TaxID=1813537 RepID=A0ABQ7MU36_BRACM|nr:hypothetical protein IGI04_016818 [Brassica rapa subsp. trilocularis]
MHKLCAFDSFAGLVFDKWMASDKCQKEKRKTVNGEYLLWVVTNILGFEDYLPGTLEAAFTSSPLLFQSFYNSNTLGSPLCTPKPKVYHPSSSISKSWTPPRQAKPEKKLVATELCGNMISFFIFSSGKERSMASKSFTSSCLILKGEAR